MTRCSVKNIWVLALGTGLDPTFKTLTFGNQTNAQEAVTRVTAECAGYMRSEHVTPSMSQVKAFPLFYEYIIQRAIYSIHLHFFLQSTMEEAHGQRKEADSDNLWELLDSPVGWLH